MLARPNGRRLLASALLLTFGLVGCSDTYETPIEPEFGISSNGSRGAREFEVYTQNLFHGGDTEPIFTLDFNDVPAVIQEANIFWNDVQNSDFTARAVEIVDEIEHRMPHVVGFQEVFRLVVLDGGFQPVGGLDMLTVVETEIASRGLPYVAEVVQDGTEVTLPLGFDPGIPGISLWLNVTDRVASFRRTDVDLLEQDQGEYSARFPLGPVTLTRGWARLAVEHTGTTYHFVNTHLEIQQLAPVQAGQAAELINVVVDGLEGVTIIAGDLNSNAATEEGNPTWTPTYDDLIGAGFTDVWATARHRRGDPGLTCCHDKSLVGTSEFDQRIDFVLVRSSADQGHSQGHRHGLFRADIVGEEDGDRTEGGLWPSDHAGLVGSMRLPTGLGRQGRPHRRVH